MKETDKKLLLYSTVIPLAFVLTLWIIKGFEWLYGIDLGQFGLRPMSWSGLIGIITSPLLHADFAHLSANSLPLLVLGSCLFYFYKQLAVKVSLLIYILTGIWVWFAGRNAIHIGASGVVYGLASFLFISGLIRRNPPLMAITMFVAFLYGSMIWGIFPDFFPEKNISWEGHFMGLLAGSVLAIYYRNDGPQRKKYSWDYEEEDDEDDENAYWKKGSTSHTA